MLYEKAVRPPPADSLREALFLTVWLRRQEIEIQKTKAILMALGDIVAGKGNEGAVKGFNAYYAAALPFIKKEQAATDAKMLEAMRKEVARGPVFFKPVEEKNLFKDKAKSMSLPDSFRKNLADKSRGFLRKVDRK